MKNYLNVRGSNVIVSLQDNDLNTLSYVRADSLYARGAYVPEVGSNVWINGAAYETKENDVVIVFHHMDENGFIGFYREDYDIIVVNSKELAERLKFIAEHESKDKGVDDEKTNGACGHSGGESSDTPESSSDTTV